MERPIEAKEKSALTVISTSAQSATHLRLPEALAGSFLRNARSIGKPLGQLFAFSILLSLMVSNPVLAKSKYSLESPLSVEQQKSLAKGVSYLKKQKPDKATPIFAAVIAQCNDLPKCLSVAEYCEQWGFQLVDVRRALLKKALGLCRTRDDYILCALKGRQYEAYEVTRQAIQQMISDSNSPEELTDLAKKAHEVALNDVTHLALEKAYASVKTVPEALEFARQASVLGMEDMVRKCLKELIDDEPKARQLCLLLRKIDVYGFKDLNRECLKKALTQCMTVQDFAEVWEEARRQRQKDIFEVAAYRGKKLKLLQQIRGDREAHSQKVDEWKQDRSRKLEENQQRVDEELSRQPSDREGGQSSGPQSGF